MAGINKVILVGNLGKDPEIFKFDNGTKKASFTVATNDSYKDKEGNKVDRTEWHNVVLYRGLAEISEQYLKKGQLVYIEGSIRTRSWDGTDGKKQYMTEIEAAEMTMLGSKKDED
jgi:single-strand DNA-binding protein